MHFAWATIVALALAAAAQSAAADGDRKRDRRQKHEEKFVSGPCKVERKWGKSGEFKEKQECRGVAVAGVSREHEEKFDDGSCKVERRWSKEGEFKQEVECRGGRPVALAVLQPQLVLPQAQAAPGPAAREKQCRPLTYEQQLPDGRWRTVREMDCSGGALRRGGAEALPSSAWARPA